MSARGVRVRFAPSPTGYLHVGGARTALFNWLYARHHQGAFVLRIEDTDEARYHPDWEAAIVDGLRWLGLDWDEGPTGGGPHGAYRQSERQELYARYARALIDAGAAYECGEGPAICLRVDQRREFVVEDLIRGKVTFPPGSLEDFVIIKSGGGPLYNFAAVVDDHAMEISHVIRGEEHLANTPKQLLMYEALGWQPPAFAHLPIILNEQRAKLSKRDGAAYLADFRDLGILPEALFNFLALLGWSSPDGGELLSREELIARFDLDRVVKHPAIFDVAKLRWMNGEYLKTQPLDAITEETRRLLAQAPAAHGQPRADAVPAAVALLRDRVRTVADIIAQGTYLIYDGPVEPAADALAKHCAAPEVVDRLAQLRERLAGLRNFAHDDIEAAVRGLANEHGVKAAAYIHPLRVALTGQAVSPGIFEVAAIVGQPLALRRLDELIARLRRRPVEA